MAARARRSVVARKIVNYSWAVLGTAAPVVVPAATKVLLGSFILATAFEETLVRVRGMLHIGSDQAGAVEAQIGAFGFIRVTDTALAVGVTAIPSPVFNADDDGWVLWQPFAQSGLIAAGRDGERYMLDTKAQRIVRESQALAVVIENAHATAGLQVMFQLRALARFRS